MAGKLTKILKEAQISEEAQELVVEAWNEKLTEARDQIGAELRLEFAQKYEHDKSVIAEAVEGFVNAELKIALTEKQAEANALKSERALLETKNAKIMKVMESFVLGKLKSEVAELHADRQRADESMIKAEAFIKESLTAELGEFAKDKQALTEQRVKLIKEGRSRIKEAKAKFIERASKATEQLVKESLRSELTQLKTDIKEARENEFGRKIFESFAGEYGRSQLLEGTELGKERKRAVATIAQLEQLSESKDKIQTELAVTKDLLERTRKMTSLMKPLNGEKQSVMEGLLEGVQTKELDSAFDRYLPTVLGEQKQPNKLRNTRLHEGLKAQNGNKTNKVNESVKGGSQADVVELDEIRRLAGL